MRCQKFIPGDIIREVERDRYFIVYRARLLKYDLIQIQLPVDEIPRISREKPQLTYEQFTETIEKEGLYELVYRTFSRVSDYHCRELCKVRSGCRDCPLFIRPRILREIYFLGDEVTIKDSNEIYTYRATVTGVKIPNLYYYTADRVYIRYRQGQYQSEDLIIPSSSITVEEVIEKLKNRKNELWMEYELRYPESEKRFVYSIIKKSEDIRLYHRKGYTLDEDILTKIKIINGE